MILLERAGKLGIGREERGGAADPPQEGKEEGEGLVISRVEASLILSWKDREERGSY